MNDTNYPPSKGQVLEQQEQVKQEEPKVMYHGEDNPHHCPVCCISAPYMPLE